MAMSNERARRELHSNMDSDTKRSQKTTESSAVSFTIISKGGKLNERNLNSTHRKLRQSLLHREHRL